MTTRITFVPHTHSLDQQAGLASGHSDVELSEQGVREAEALRQHLAGRDYAAAFTSDLRRAWRTAEIALADRDIPIIRDARLRGIDFGIYTSKPRTKVRPITQDHINTPFPGGESHLDVITRYREALDEIKRRYPGQSVLIFAHSVYPLKVILQDKPILEVLRDKSVPSRDFVIP